MRLADRGLKIPDRRAVGHDDMDVDAEPVGVEADRVLDPGQPVERVERGLRVQDHAAFGVDARAASGEQVVDIFPFDAVAAEFAFDRRDVAQKAARRETDPHVVDVQTRDAFGLFDRLAHDMLGLFHVGDIAALDAAALALAGAEHMELAVGGLPRDQRADLPRPDIERGDDLFDARRRHGLSLLRRGFGDGIDRGARVVELRRRHLPFVRQA